MQHPRNTNKQPALRFYNIQHQTIETKPIIHLYIYLSDENKFDFYIQPGSTQFCVNKHHVYHLLQRPLITEGDNFESLKWFIWCSLFL